AEINWPTDLKKMPDLGVVLSIMRLWERDVAGQTWEVPHGGQRSADRYLVKTDGSIWSGGNSPTAQRRLDDLERGVRLSLSAFNGTPSKTLAFDGPIGNYLLHGVAILPPG